MNTVAFLGNYAPRCCGIATFTQDLRNAVMHAQPTLQTPVVMMTDNLAAYSYPQEVKLVIEENCRSQYRQMAGVLNASGVDVLALQHEYGIYGGPSGEWLLDLLRGLEIPVVTTCHTVLKNPSSEQLRVMVEVARYSSKVVVMTEKGRLFLKNIYGVADGKIAVIPHGIPNSLVGQDQRSNVRSALGWDGHQVLFTFGLLSPNKGIEYAIRALPKIVEKNPNVLYVVAGVTHPNLVKECGEKYRESLLQLAMDLGVAEHLRFVDRFVSRDELVSMMAAADLYTTPYLDEAQITSGTLAYAYGMGKPVISTPYWHAAELLAEGKGMLVPFRDAQSISDAANFLLENHDQCAAMAEAALQQGRNMTWSAVGKKYLDVYFQAQEVPTNLATKQAVWKKLEPQRFALSY